MRGIRYESPEPAVEAFTELVQGYPFSMGQLLYQVV